MTDIIAQSFNWIDYTIFGIIAFSAVTSFFRGFAHEIVSLLAWVLGVILALKYGHVVQPLFLGWFASTAVRYFVAFISIFFVMVLCGMLLNALLSMLISKAGLSLTNRFVGMIFGVLRGVTIVAILLLMLVNLGTVKDTVALKKSVAAEKFQPFVMWLDQFLPDKMRTMTHWISNKKNSFKEIKL